MVKNIFKRNIFLQKIPKKFNIFFKEKLFQKSKNLDQKLNPRNIPNSESLKIMERTNEIDIETQDFTMRKMYEERRKNLSKQVKFYLDSVKEISIKKKGLIDSKRTW